MAPQELHSRFQEAFNRHDLDAAVALYEPCAVLARVDGAAEGLDAIREAFRGYFAIRPAVELTTLGVARAGDLALLEGKWTLEGTAPDGSAIYREGRSTEVARLQPDGRWLYVIDRPYALT
jgi:ketosteroid isomerase-like protein